MIYVENCRPEKRVEYARIACECWLHASRHEWKKRGEGRNRVSRNERRNAGGLRLAEVLECHILRDSLRLTSRPSRDRPRRGQTFWCAGYEWRDAQADWSATWPEPAQWIASENREQW